MTLGFFDDLEGVRFDAGRDLEGDEAVSAVGVLVGRAQDIAGAADVVDGEGHECQIGVRFAGAGEGGEIVVVGVAGGDGLLEDSRITGDAGDIPGLDHALEPAGVQQVAAQEVEPDALAKFKKSLCCARHGAPSFRPCSAVRWQ
jgi:hypothetical protein